MVSHASLTLMTLNITLKSNCKSVAIERVEKCIQDIKTWMIDNYLMLNDSKTELLHVTSKFSDVPHIASLTAGDSVITPAQNVRNLGAIFVSHLSMTTHVNNICRNASFALRKIGKIRKYLDKSTTEQLIHAFVSSRLDSNNILLAGLPSKDISKLQRVQNSAARLTSLTKKRDHITPVLHDLHWLPVHSRVVFKVLLLTYKILNDMAPGYLSELVHSYVPSRSLRSSSKALLKIPSHKTESYGARAFSIIAPQLWNELPQNIRQAQSINHFKNSAKTHLFNIAYNL